MFLRSKIFIIISAHVLTFVWWFLIRMRDASDSLENVILGIPYNVILLTIISSLIIRFIYSGPKKIAEKSIQILTYSLGIWAMGSLVFIAQLFIEETAPVFPSWGGIFFDISYVGWITGLLLLAKNLSLQNQMTSFIRKISFFLVPFIIIYCSYYVLISIVEVGHLTIQEWNTKIISDFVFMFLDSTLLLLISFYIFFIATKKINSYYLKPIVILSGSFGLLYLSDLYFAYSTYFNVTYPMDSWLDVMYGTSITGITVAVLLFAKKTDKDS